MKNKIIRILTAFAARPCSHGRLYRTPPLHRERNSPQKATRPTTAVLWWKKPRTRRPLPPDGNATLVDDFGGNKQIITVTTKAGNYFYILIDRATEEENTVHFLNQVDDADLDTLINDKQTTEEPPAVCTCTEKCEAGAVNATCPVCATDHSKCTGKEAETEETESPQEKEKQNNMGSILLIVADDWRAWRRDVLLCIHDKIHYPYHRHK